MSNAVNAAIHHAEADSVTNVLLSALTMLRTDTSVSVEIREKSVLGTIQLFESKNLFAEAMLVLDSLDNTMFKGFDSLSIEYLKLRIAVLGDTNVATIDKLDTLHSITSLEILHAKQPSESFEKSPFTKTDFGKAGDSYFEVRPNPATDMVYIGLKNENSFVGNMRIVNSLGIVVSEIMPIKINSQVEAEISLTSFRSGMYWIELSNNSSTHFLPLYIIK
ncbi:MAG: T9SS type A sorting domain-containing protein [Ignavibacteria bacterium]|nr:T9SS type A sorting domain-containing protein [Ignavibacteria bacterium]